MGPLSRRKRKRKQQSVVRPAAGPPRRVDTENDIAPSLQHVSWFRRRFLVAAVLVGVWWAALIGLVVLTANPVTLNQAQIRRAATNGSIVTAKVVDSEAGTVEIVKDWTAGDSRGRVTIDRLAESGARDGKTYILPLTTESQRGTVRIAPAKIPSQPPPIYEATDEAVHQLTVILDSMKPRAGKAGK